MRIDIIKSRVMFYPQTAEEKAKLEAIWRLLVECVGESRKLVPVGEYVPQKDDRRVTFHIEGVDPEENTYVEIRLESDADLYCRTCSKVISLKAGDVIPMCCGKMMEILD